MREPWGISRANASKIAGINILLAFWLDTESCLIKISTPLFAVIQIGELVFSKTFFERNISALRYSPAKLSLDSLYCSVCSLNCTQRIQFGNLRNIRCVSPGGLD